MKLYVAGKLGVAERSLKELMQLLISQGHEFVYDWTIDTSPQKPYLDYPDINRVAAEKMLKAANECDAFILLANDNLLGALIECGIALGSTIQKSQKKVYLVGKDFRQSIFYTLSSVVICSDTDELVEALAANEPMNLWDTKAVLDDEEKEELYDNLAKLHAERRRARFTSDVPLY
ncbi:MAG: hypothetical protein Q8P54_01485 [bacterium]|nr:hypothetical protein [bacterium]